MVLNYPWLVVQSRSYNMKLSDRPNFVCGKIEQADAPNGAINIAKVIAVAATLAISGCAGKSDAPQKGSSKEVCAKFDSKPVEGACLDNKFSSLDVLRDTCRHGINFMRANRNTVLAMRARYQ